MSLGRRQTLIAAALLMAGMPALAQAADAPKPTAPNPYRELMWGNPKAKVTVIEYASLTCPHCARFTNDVFPEIKKNYIDTGKIRFVFRDYPLDNLGLAAAVLARCAPGDRGKNMIEVLFKNQNEWARSPKPIEPLRAYAQLSGLTAEQVDACLNADEPLKTIQQEQQKATTLYKVEATPTFYIDDEKVSGEKTYADFAKLLDAHLAKAK
jgi:protein-disulfide isomerase